MPVPHHERREYRAAYIRKHYRDNKQYYRTKAKERRQRIVLLIRELKNKACADCGNKYPFYVMQFDHLGEKTIGLAAVAAQGWSEKRIREEAAKCDVVCANCHAVRTHNRLTPEIGL